MFLLDLLVRLRLRQRLSSREHISDFSTTQSRSLVFGSLGDVLDPRHDIFPLSRILRVQLFDIALPYVLFLLMCKRLEIHCIVTSRQHGNIKSHHPVSCHHQDALEILECSEHDWWD